MNINIEKYLPHLVALFIIILPLSLFAAHAPGESSPTTIKNPLKSDEVEGILTDIMTLVFKVGVIVVVFFIIFSGFKFVMSRGNSGERDKAKEMLWATLIGGAVLLGADVIATVVYKTVKTTVGG